MDGNHDIQRVDFLLQGAFNSISFAKNCPHSALSDAGIKAHISHNMTLKTAL